MKIARINNKICFGQSYKILSMKSVWIETPTFQTLIIVVHMFSVNIQIHIIPVFSHNFSQIPGIIVRVFENLFDTIATIFYIFLLFILYGFRDYQTLVIYPLVLPRPGISSR